MYFICEDCASNLAPLLTDNSSCVKTAILKLMLELIIINFVDFAFLRWQCIVITIKPPVICIQEYGNILKAPPYLPRFCILVAKLVDPRFK